ncbi:hypothetical protein L1887_45865 [Cichorium endivia]|nr:hypothetical protein L1887_45865 [Cichorium endivia]
MSYITVTSSFEQSVLILNIAENERAQQHHMSLTPRSSDYNLVSPVVESTFKSITLSKIKHLSSNMFKDLRFLFAITPLALQPYSYRMDHGLCQRT